jgi:8-oxo-dGTP pyrophosphatase MutT (NUDIX family)
MSWKPLFEHPLFRVEGKQVQTPAGPLDAVRISSNDWVNVVALTTNRDAVLIRQPRFGIGIDTLEIPGGIVDDGESPIEAGKRELMEETGYGEGQWTSLGFAHPNPAIQDNRVFFFLATDVALEGAADPDPEEDIEVDLTPWSDIPRLLQTGAITHALVVAALQRALLQELLPDLASLTPPELERAAEFDVSEIVAAADAADAADAAQDTADDAEFDAASLPDYGDDEPAEGWYTDEIDSDGRPFFDADDVLEEVLPIGAPLPTEEVPVPAEFDEATGLPAWVIRLPALLDEIGPPSTAADAASLASETVRLQWSTERLRTMASGAPDPVKVAMLGLLGARCRALQTRLGLDVGANRALERLRRYREAEGLSPVVSLAAGHRPEYTTWSEDARHWWTVLSKGMELASGLDAATGGSS